MVKLEKYQKSKAHCTNHPHKFSVFINKISKFSNRHVCPKKLIISISILKIYLHLQVQEILISNHVQGRYIINMPIRYML